MARISEDTIQRVAAASDVVDVIGEHLQLKRAGANWKGLCPFHHEKTPSFHVNPARQTFKCFGCGAGGSVFRFVMDYEHVDYPTAIRRLASRANIPIAEESAGDEVRRGARDRLLTLHRDAAAWFHENLMRRKTSAHAREYLKGRGIGNEIAVRWKLGYAPDSWDALTQYLREQRYSTAEIIESGLVTVKESENPRPEHSGDSRRQENPKSKVQNPKSYDRFRDRVMFPICNDYGEVIAFSGRTLNDDPAKYVNSPETPIFTKGRVLFGLEKTKRAIIDAREVVVCEGQLDLISAFEAGVQNVTAPQGTAFTPQQARLLRRFVGDDGSVVLCFDSDTAGRKAVERSLPALLGVGLTVRVARVPAGEDPDSLVRSRGADALRAVIASAREYFDNTLEEDLRPDTSARDRAALARKLAAFVRIIEDPALQQAVSTRVRSRLELAEGVFASLVASAPRPNEEPEPEVAESDEDLDLPESVLVLCRLAILSPAARAWMRARPEPASAFGPEFTVVDRLIQADAPIEDPAVFSTFAASLSPAEERALAGLHLGKVPENPDKLAADAWQGLLRQKLNAEIVSLHARLKHPDFPPADVLGVQKQILDLQKRLGHV
jgi:DNA primase